MVDFFRLKYKIMKTSFKNSFVQIALQYTLPNLKQELDEVEDVPLFME